MALDYEAMPEYVRARLAPGDVEAASDGLYPFRKRSEHTRRVYLWVLRLLEGPDLPETLDRQAVLTAAIFHDVGYIMVPNGPDHAVNSAELFIEYATQQGMDLAYMQKTANLIALHSQKTLMEQPDTPLELVLLMEADLLDETGAMALVWDCLSVVQKGQPGYEAVYHHMLAHTGKQMAQNPMRTILAQEFWQRKQALVREYLDQYAWDLGVEVRM